MLYFVYMLLHVRTVFSIKQKKCSLFKWFRVGNIKFQCICRTKIFITQAIALFSIAKNRSWRLTAKHRGIELRTNNASLTSFKYTLASVLCSLYFLCFRKCSSGKQQNIVVGVIAIPTHAILIDSQREPFLFVFLSLESFVTTWRSGRRTKQNSKRRKRNAGSFCVEGRIFRSLNK